MTCLLSMLTSHLHISSFRLSKVGEIMRQEMKYHVTHWGKSHDSNMTHQGGLGVTHQNVRKGIEGQTNRQTKDRMGQRCCKIIGWVDELVIIKTEIGSFVSSPKCPHMY